MMAGGRSYAAPGRGRPWTFYALAALFGCFLLFLYGTLAASFGANYLRTVQPVR